MSDFHVCYVACYAVESIVKQQWQKLASNTPIYYIISGKIKLELEMFFFFS